MRAAGALLVAELRQAQLLGHLTGILAGETGGAEAIVHGSHPSGPHQPSSDR